MLKIKRVRRTQKEDTLLPNLSDLLKNVAAAQEELGSATADLIAALVEEGGDIDTLRTLAEEDQTLSDAVACIENVAAARALDEEESEELTDRVNDGLELLAEDLSDNDHLSNDQE